MAHVAGEQSRLTGDAFFDGAPGDPMVRTDTGDIAKPESRSSRALAPAEAKEPRTGAFSFRQGVFRSVRGTCPIEDAGTAHSRARTRYKFEPGPAPPGALAK